MEGVWERDYFGGCLGTRLRWRGGWERDYFGGGSGNETTLEGGLGKRLLWRGGLGTRLHSVHKTQYVFDVCGGVHTGLKIGHSY